MLPSGSFFECPRVSESKLALCRLGLISHIIPIFKIESQFPTIFKTAFSDFVQVTCFGIAST
jgi:hypothetical protein